MYKLNKKYKSLLLVWSLKTKHAYYLLRKSLNNSTFLSVIFKFIFALKRCSNIVHNRVLLSNLGNL